MTKSYKYQLAAKRYQELQRAWSAQRWAAYWQKMLQERVEYYFDDARGLHGTIISSCLAEVASTAGGR